MKYTATPLGASALLAAMLASPAAFGHAVLKTSAPPAGATVRQSLNEVALTFNEKVEEAFSSVTVAGPGGASVATPKAKADPANPAMLHLPLPALAPGAYVVKWAVAGKDGHRRTGEFTFQVK